jgi:hypothetical protein
VSQEDPTSRQDPLTHGLAPVGSLGGRIDLVNDVVDLPRNEIDDPVRALVSTLLRRRPYNVSLGTETALRYVRWTRVLAPSSCDGTWGRAVIAFVVPGDHA